MLVLPKPLQFLWDEGNFDKNWIKHHLSNTESEETFFDPQKKILKDLIHSQQEKRFILLGKTKKEKMLFIVFTVRKNQIRIISARIINKKASLLYEKKS